jgi:elongation factor 1-gamma
MKKKMMMTHHPFLTFHPRNMTFGKIYSYPKNSRVFKSLIAAKYVGVELDQPAITLGKDNRTPEFLAKFPTGLVPAFENDRVQLIESNAIAFYVASQGDGRLLGRDKEQKAQVMQWLTYLNGQIENPIIQWILPVFGITPFDENARKRAVADVKSGLEVLDRVLENKTYLVGESITLADIVAACSFYLGVVYLLSPEHIGPYKNVVRYLRTLYAQPNFHAVIGDVEFTKEEKKQL